MAEEISLRFYCFDIRFYRKPKIIGLPKVLEGIVGFDYNYEKFLGRPIS